VVRREADAEVEELLLAQGTPELAPVVSAPEARARHLRDRRALAGTLDEQHLPARVLPGGTRGTPRWAKRGMGSAGTRTPGPGRSLSQVLSGNAVLSEACNRPVWDNGGEADRTRTGAHRSAQVQKATISVTFCAPWLRPRPSERRKVLPRPRHVDTLSSVNLDAMPNAFSHGLAQERGLSDRRLRGLLADGTLERLGHGLYRKADAPPADLDRIEIALRASDATLCLTTA